MRYSFIEEAFLGRTGVDPKEIATGRTPWGIRYATMGHFRMIYLPRDGTHEALSRLDTVDGPAFKPVRDGEMPTLVHDALLEACKCMA